MSEDASQVGDESAYRSLGLHEKKYTWVVYHFGSLVSINKLSPGYSERRFSSLTFGGRFSILKSQIITNNHSDLREVSTSR